MKAIFGSLLTLAFIILIAQMGSATHKTYGAVYTAKTDDFFEKGAVGPYVVDTTGKFVITVMWEAKNNSIFSTSKVSVRLEVFQKPGGDTILKSMQKRNANKEDQMKVEFRFNQTMLERARTVHFRVYEFCGDGDPDSINLCPSNQDHTITYKIRVEWKPDH